MNFVVVPRVLENQRTKQLKTDRLDAMALLLLSKLRFALGDNLRGCSHRPGYPESLKFKVDEPKITATLRGRDLGRFEF